MTDTYVRASSAFLVCVQINVTACLALSIQFDCNWQFPGVVCCKKCQTGGCASQPLTSHEPISFFVELISAQLSENASS